MMEMLDAERMTALHTTFVQNLAAQGHVSDPRWLSAFRDIPRDAFVPYFFQPHTDRPGWRLVRRPTREWAEKVYSMDALITQLDGRDDAHGDTADGAVTSSSSAPSLMAVMLDALDLRDGHAVLEIGTGTGYNTALLCHRLGDSHITSIDVDPALVDHARQRLAAFDYHPHLHAGDGRTGHSERAPHDRIIVTVGIAAIPPEWIDQTRDGGIIIVPVDRHGRGGLLARLTVHDGIAEGRFLPDCGWFMPTRSRHADAALKALREITYDHGTQRTTDLPIDAATDTQHPADFFVALRTAGYSHLTFTPDDGSPQQTWLATADGSWACHTTSDDGTHTVRQGGPTRIWDQIEAAHAEWHTLGQPTRERFRLTVRRDGTHTLSLDNPHSPYTWPLVGSH